MSLFDDVVLPGFIIVASAGIVSTGGCRVGIGMVRYQTVENNAAEWRCNPKTGEKEFVWLTTKPKAEKE